MSGAQRSPLKPSKFVMTFEAEVTDQPNKTVPVMAVLVDQVSNEFPLKSVPGAQNWELIRDFKLADPSFFQPGCIDAILGTDVLKYVMLDGSHVAADEEPMAVKLLKPYLVGP